MTYKTVIQVHQAIQGWRTSCNSDDPISRPKIIAVVLQSLMKQNRRILTDCLIMEPFEEVLNGDVPKSTNVSEGRLVYNIEKFRANEAMCQMRVCGISTNKDKIRLFTNRLSFGHGV